MISVLIATKNRPVQIKNCITSLLAGSYRNFEILVADQSPSKNTKNIVASFRSDKIRYFTDQGSGKTKAINTLILKAKGDILSFIDDDNIVSSGWLRSVATYHANNPKIYGVFGTILPYQKEKHPGYICPSIFQLSANATIRDPYSIHHQSLGLGSNMSLRKTVFQNAGLFQPWLGPGNRGLSGGEDGELIYKILRNGYMLAYDQSNVVYHDRWLTDYQNRMLQTRYTAGEIAYLFFYTLKGDTHIRRNLLFTIRDRMLREGFIAYIKQTIRSHQHYSLIACIKELYFSCTETIAIIRGIFIGFYHYLRLR